jgi:hypothetical protein
MGPLSPTSRKISALLSGTVSVFSGNFKRFATEAETLPTPITLPLIVGGLLTLEFTAFSVVVIV